MPDTGNCGGCANQNTNQCGNAVTTDNVEVIVWGSAPQPRAVIKYCGDFYVNLIEGNTDKPTVGAGKTPKTYAGAFPTYDAAIKFLIEQHLTETCGENCDNGGDNGGDNGTTGWMPDTGTAADGDMFIFIADGMSGGSLSPFTPVSVPTEVDTSGIDAGTNVMLVADGNGGVTAQVMNCDPCAQPVDDDRDNDGLTNDEELAIGTDPDVADTDAGGENDGDEVAGGRNPLDPSDDETGGVLGL